MIWMLTSAALAGTGHCTDAETVLFSCAVKGGKHVSVCQDAGLASFGVTGGMQYRFGPPGAPELRFPEDSSDITVWTHREVMLARATGESLAFTNGGYTYTLSALGSGSPDAFFGVTVEKDGQTLATLSCEEGSVANHFDALPAVIKAP